MNEQITPIIRRGEESRIAGHQAQALEAYRQAIQLFQEYEDSELAVEAKKQYASICNNLGHLLICRHEYKEAVKPLRRAVNLYQQLLETDWPDHAPFLAMAHFNLAQASAPRDDLYGWRKNLRPAIDLYKALSGADPRFLPYLANAQSSLAESYTHDEPPMAEVHWKQAIKTYEQALATDPSVRPFLAACFNNLAYNQKQEYDYSKAVLSYTQALEIYQELMQENAETFLPFVAGTFQNLGVLFTEMGEEEEAIANYRRALTLYDKMARQMPDLVRPYQATIHHNLGVVYDDKQMYDKALLFYQQALQERRQLAAERPKQFLPDHCATGLNLATLYQTLLEEHLDIRFREKALPLLDEVEAGLGQIDQTSPVVKSMESDLAYFRDFFINISEDELIARGLMQKINHLNEEIMSTQDISEKLEYQSLIQHMLEDFLKTRPKHPEMTEQLALALAHRSWLHLLHQDVPKALAAAEKALDLCENEPHARINRAHALLFSDRWDEALAAYDQLRATITVDKKRIPDIIAQDFLALQIRGISHPDMEKVKTFIQ